MRKNLKILLLFAVGLAMLSLKPPMPEKSYTIEDQSQLSIKGSSNVNQFSCQCKQDFPRGTVRFETENRGQTLHFQQATLSLQTRRLDCGHKGINRDLQKALLVDEHPLIEIELLDARQKGDKLLNECDGWVPLDASSRITIAGVSRKVHLPIQGRRLSDHRYQFKSAKTIHMSDFGIEPPKPLFGLITVDDDITINLDLTVNIQEGV